MRAKAIEIVAVVAAVASATMTLLPWVDVSPLGLPLRWNGLGIFIGEHGEHYGACSPAWSTACRAGSC